MTWYLQKLALVGIVLAASLSLSACGGGNSPDPVVEVVTVKKFLDGQSSNDVPSKVALLVNSGISVLAKKCATVRPEPSPPGTNRTAILFFAVLVDIAATDVEKAKSLGYSLFSPDDIFPATIVAC